MIRLPISGEHGQWRPATGNDDIALADSPTGLAGALAYATRSASLESGLDPAALPVGDLDRLVVAGRREVRGDTLVAEGRCERCVAAVDVHFGLAAYMDHNRPRASRLAAPIGDGWYRLHRYELTFRLPRVEDVLAVAHCEDPRAELLAACTRGRVTASIARTAERAMEALAPTLRADVAGTCPECGAAVLLDVDARELCMAELRFLAGAVYDDANLIASVYHWTQDVILDLPSTRRRRYADLIAGRSAHIGVGVSVG